jgi:predicted metalloprotease with PDZ domain
VELAEARLRIATEQDWIFTDADLTSLLRRVAGTEIDFFGEAPQSLITCLVVPNGVYGPGRFDIYGAHTGGSLILWLDPGISYAELTERAASVVAHEMFHGWLGEAIRQREPETLWFTEGATSLYAARMLVAAGIWSEDHARATLNARLRRDFHENPRLGDVAIADAAAMVMADPETVRLGYAGGIAACLALEQWLAAGGGTARPLDTLLRHLYRHRDDGHLTRQRLESAILAVTGLDAASWLARHIYDRVPLPDLSPVI